MTERLHIKPARPGEVLRDPHTRRALPEEGGFVPDTTFYRRRLADGDAVRVDEEPRQNRAPVRVQQPTVAVAQKGE